MSDEYTLSRLERFMDELDNMTDVMENMEYYGSAGDVYVTLNGKREVLRIDAPTPATPEEAEQIRRWTEEAMAMALEEIDLAEQNGVYFISEDLALGC